MVEANLYIHIPYSNVGSGEYLHGAGAENYRGNLC